MTTETIDSLADWWAANGDGDPVVSPNAIPRGATEGPLKDLIPVFIDIESYVSDTISLSKMTLRQYVAASRLESMAIAVGDSDPTDIFFAADTEGLSEDLPIITQDLIDTLKMLSRDPEYVIVAHNAAWDTRGLRFFAGIPHPINTWCTMEGAMGAWPELPGGYGLKNLSTALKLPENRTKYPVDLRELARVRHKTLKGPVLRKDISEDLATCIDKIAADSGMELDWGRGLTTNDCDLIMAFYNIRDVDVLREVYYRQIARIPGVEQEVALRTHRQRRHYFDIDPVLLENLVAKLDENAKYAEKQAMEYITDEQKKDIFNRGETGTDSLKSIRYQRLRRIINTDMNPSEEFGSTSLKKLSQITLAQNPTISALLTQTSRAGKMMSHKRRSVVFHGVDKVDVELAPFRAHTFRFSSPSVGKGLNCIAEGTPILTDQGWVPVECVTVAMRVWDGVEFVSHRGPVDKGVRPCITVGGVTMTPDHKILQTDGEWVEAWHAQLYGTSNLVSASDDGRCWVRPPRPQGMASTTECLSDAIAETWPPCPGSPLSTPSNANDVQSDVDTPAYRQSPTTPSGQHASPAGVTSRIDASTTGTPNSTSGADGESPFVQNGRTTPQPSYATSRPLIDTTRSRTGISTGLTTIEDMSPETSGSSARRSRLKTDAVQSSTRGSHSDTSQKVLGCPSQPCTSTTEKATSKRVFDLVDCGPRHRFQARGWIVHNCHNIPKHDREIAEPIRKVFRIPDDMVFVRADLANVEFRVEGWLTKCPAVLKMFDAEYGGDVNTDPYCASWEQMTGQKIVKKDPTRQLAKAVVLGLGFMMSAAGFVTNGLLPVIANPKIPITEETLAQLIKDNNWGRPHGRGFRWILERTGCSDVVAIVAWHIHRSFNETYPEFRMTAEWLVDCVTRIGGVGRGPRSRDRARYILDEMYLAPRAPDRDRIGLEIDDDPLTARPSVRVACGPWPRTVCWREPCSRPTKFGLGAAMDYRMTTRKATGVMKPFTINLAIENVTQAAARNGLCIGVAHLERLGFPDCLHIHDEALLIVPKRRDAVLAAREALLTAFGPNNTSPFGWATIIKPEEITVTQSLFEDEKDVEWKYNDKTGLYEGGRRWQRIEGNEADMFDGLP